MPTSFAEEILATIARIHRACEAVAVPWAVGGSFASGLYGEPRATNDVDVIACLRLGDVRPFVAALGEDVYVDSDVIREAIADCRSFNVLDEQTFVKIESSCRPAALSERDSFNGGDAWSSEKARPPGCSGRRTCCCRSSRGTASAASNRTDNGGTSVRSCGCRGIAWTTAISRRWRGDG